MAQAREVQPVGMTGDRADLEQAQGAIALRI
jgi:hypothetical protein